MRTINPERVPELKIFLNSTEKMRLCFGAGFPGLILKKILLLTSTNQQIKQT